MGIVTYHPFKAAYLLGAIGFELARFPLWLVKYITSFGRQHPEWSFRQALGVRLLYSMILHVGTVQQRTPLPLSPGKEKERFIVIKPASRTYYTGPLTPTEHVKPVDIGSTWYPAPLTASSDTSSAMVILHIHGGAYVIGDGRAESFGYAANNLVKNVGATHVFAPQYRLSTLPVANDSNPFPAAIQDSLTAYLYLLNELKISPSNIVFSGDSAGGNAVISLLRYILDHGAELNIPAPSAALLWSPWVYVGEATNEKTVTGNRNFKSDYLPYAFVGWGARAYGGKGGQSVLDSPYVSFRNKPFRTQVPLWMNAGDAEMLHDDDMDWAKSMKEAGNDITIDVDKFMPHDILLLGNQLGFDKEARATSKRAGEWLKGARK